jgi:hypothetical protein
MRKVKLVVGDRKIGEYPTWAYPKGEKLGVYLMPTYELTASGTDSQGSAVARTFEVFRFGIQSTDGKSARVVGLAADQTHTIKAWLPHYIVHSATSTENGAWQVYDNFLIHDGPDTKDEVFASIGCVEIVGPNGFNEFNDFLIQLSGPAASSRAGRLAEIGKAKNMTITYIGTSRPSLKKST